MRSRARVRVAALSGVMVLALTGCGTGQTAPTARDLPSVPGVNVNDGGIAIRNAAAVFAPEGYQPGDAVPVTLTIVNLTDQQTRLTRATSPDSGSVSIDDGAVNVEIPPYGRVPVTLQLDGIRSELDGTGAVPLELEFANGATFSLQAPVAPPMERVGQREPIMEPVH